MLSTPCTVQFIELLVLGGLQNVSNDNTRVSMDELKQTKDLTDWKKITEMTEVEIESSAKSDLDCQPTDDDFWDDAKIVTPNSHRVSQ